MAKSIEYRANQVVLSYIYNSAIERAKVHPMIARKYKTIIDNCQHFESESEVLKYVHDKEKETHSYYLILAKIGKDEEYYFIKNYYIVVRYDNGEVIKAAEYTGMEKIYHT